MISLFLCYMLVSVTTETYQLRQNELIIGGECFVEFQTAVLSVLKQSHFLHGHVERIFKNSMKYVQIKDKRN